MDRRKFIYNSSLASLSVLGLHSCNQVNEETTITILHTNDMHSQIDPFPNNHNRFPGKGGFARIAALIILFRSRRTFLVSISFMIGIIKTFDDMQMDLKESRND